MKQKNNSLKLPRTKLVAAQYFSSVEDESQGMRQTVGESWRNLGGNEAVVFAASQLLIKDCICLVPSFSGGGGGGVSFLHKRHKRASRRCSCSGDKIGQCECSNNLLRVFLGLQLFFVGVLWEWSRSHMGRNKANYGFS